MLTVGLWQFESGLVLQTLQDAHKRGRWLLLEHVDRLPELFPQLDYFMSCVLEGPTFFDREKGSALPGFQLFLSATGALPLTLQLKCVPASDLFSYMTYGIMIKEGDMIYDDEISFGSLSDPRGLGAPAGSPRPAATLRGCDGQQGSHLEHLRKSAGGAAPGALRALPGASF